MSAAMSFMTSAVLAQVDRIDSPPTEEDAASYFELLERNTHILYPLIALLVVTMVIAGVLQAWRGRDLAGLSSLELKREVLLALRRGDRTVEAVARHLNISVEEAKALIAELRRDGILPPEDE